ncbi:hypothetical protein [Streptomyces violaceusniger]|uniref:Uncharacterized protein n=1 Tax=Streptomyces violaceusniger TaxID=68280 RepID=A0A4D4KSR5_STRVO|nr:hypothetical protein SVIO_023450 [Streptomyces violaceusniger]
METALGLWLQRELAALSTVSRHDVVADAGHNALVMAPEHAPGVVESIEWVRAQAAARHDHRYE